jgi:hypothetical protein
MATKAMTVGAMALLAGLLFTPALEARDRRTAAWRGPTPVDRAMADLNRAARNARWAGDQERKHFNRAMNELAGFQHRWREGRFDKGRLNKGIESIQRLVNSRQLHLADRRALSGSLFALRDFRASGGQYAGARGGYGPPPGRPW